MGAPLGVAVARLPATLGGWRRPKAADAPPRGGVASGKRPPRRSQWSDRAARWLVSKAGPGASIFFRTRCRPGSGSGRTGASKFAVLAKCLISRPKDDLDPFSPRIVCERCVGV